MNFSPLTLYVLAAIFQTAGSSGAAMLAPFFMKAHGYSVAAAGVPLVANGVGRVCSDVMSGIMATYFSPGSLLFAAMIIGIATSIVGYAFMDVMPVFLTAWIIFGLTEAMFALSLRKIGFDQSPPDRQGQRAGANGLGVGHRLYPRPAVRRFRRQVARSGRIIFSLRRAAIHRHGYRIPRRRTPLSPEKPNHQAKSVARRPAAARQNAFSRFVPGDLPVFFILGRRHARGVSLSRGQPARHQLGNRRDDRCDFAS